MTLPRSMLFVPATSERKVEKAFASDAHAVIVDLEDAVAVSEKPAARATIAAIAARQRPLPCWVRINASSTRFCLQDVLATTIPGIAGIILPKVEAAVEVATLDWLMSQIEADRGLPDRGVRLMGIIETARSLANVDAIAAASPRLDRLLFGAVDLAADLAIATDDDAVAPARFMIATASRAAGPARSIGRCCRARSRR